MAALLVGLSIMAVLMSAALPVWSQSREARAGRGTDLARPAVRARDRTVSAEVRQHLPADDRHPGRAALPSQEIQGSDYQRATSSRFRLAAASRVRAECHRPRAPDPPPFGGGQRQGGAPTSGFTFSHDAQRSYEHRATAFGQVPGPSIGIQGVVSKSKDSSIKIYNGRTKYNEWAFVYLATSQGVSAPTGQQQPGRPPGGRPPVPFPPPGSGFRTPGQPPNAPTSPFAPPPPMGRPPVRPPGV